MKLAFFLGLCTLIFTGACDNHPKADASIEQMAKLAEEKETPKSDNQLVKKEGEIPRGFILNGKDTLVPVNQYNKDIYWELKYATSDNFMHRVLYDTLEIVYVQKDVALRLAKCQEALSSKNSNYHLLVYDGLRPLSVQWEMWNALDTIPPGERGMFVSNPKNGSVHNYGAAVDITICTSTKAPLDMGAKYDEIGKIAYPSLEAQFLASGELTKEQVDNRKLLRSVMKSQYFSNIPSEWWHFNAASRKAVSGKYKIITKELQPFPSKN